MTKVCIFLIVVGLFFPGCNLKQREDEIRKKEILLQEREQQILTKEKTLQLKEDEINKREQRLDSASRDTTRIINPALVGKWLVSMTCTETTCPGSAVGDTKTEQWDISYQANTIIARAMVNNQVIRIYTGFYTGNTIELVEERSSATSEPSSKMVVRLRIVNEKVLEGQRDIVRENGCKVVYALKLEKQ